MELRALLARLRNEPRTWERDLDLLLVSLLSRSPCDGGVFVCRLSKIDNLDFLKERQIC